MKISLFNYSMLWYISSIATFLLHIQKRNSCPTHIFKPIPRMDFNDHTAQEYFRQTYNYLGPLQTSTTVSNLLCNILQETRFSSCQRNQIYKITLGSIPNDWKHLLRTETSQQSFIKAFCCNNKVPKSLIKSLKDFQSSLIKKITSPFYLSLRNIIFSVLITGVKCY